MSTAAVSTFAGSGSATYTNGTGTAASFSDPTGIAVWGGYGYVADGGRIRRVDLSTAAVTTLAGDGTYSCWDATNPLSAELAPGNSLVTDGAALYWVQACSPGQTQTSVRKLDLSTGAVSTLVTVSKNWQALTVGGDGNLYSGWNGVLDRINPTTGAVTPGIATVSAGTGCSWNPFLGMAADSTSVWAFVRGTCSSGAQPQAVYQIDTSSGTVTLLPGSSQSAAAPSLIGPQLVSTANYLYSNNNNRVVRISKSDGTVVSVAGTGSSGYLDGTGTQAWFSGGGGGIDTDGTNLWVIDETNPRLRELASASALTDRQPPAWTSTVTLGGGYGVATAAIAGDGTPGHVDANGTSAELNAPAAVHVVGAYAYVLDNGYLRKYDLTNGAVTTVAGTGTTSCADRTTPTSATLQGTRQLTDDGTFLYWVDDCVSGSGQTLIRRMSISTGAVSTVTAIQNYYPDVFSGITIGPGGQLFVSHGADIDKVDPYTGQQTHLTTLPAPTGTTFSSPTQSDLAADGTSLWAVAWGACSAPSNICGVLDQVNPTTGAITQLAAGKGDTAGTITPKGPIVSSGTNLYAFGFEPADAAGAPGFAGLVRYGKTSGVQQLTQQFQSGFADLDLNGSSMLVTDSGTNRLYRIVQNPAAGGSGTGANADHNCVQNNTSASDGDPVDLDSGAYYEIADDLRVPGRGASLDLSRTYDTRSASQASRLGYGWVDSYDWNLSLDTSGGPPNGDVTIRCFYGATTTFHSAAQGGYEPASPAVMATLVHNTSGTWTYSVRRTMTYTFNSSGQLTTITDLNGYATNLTYSSGLLTTVTDPAGRTLTFTYDGSNRIHTVTDGLPRTVTYTYDGSGNLATVTDVDGRVWTYGYDAAHRLTTLTDPRTNTITTHYDSSGRVDWQTDRRGKQTTFAYTAPGGGGTYTTTVTHPLGNQDVYTYLNHRLTQVVNGYGTSDAATTSYSYDDNTNAISSVTDGRGHSSTATYDAYGNQLTATDQLSHTTTWTYNSFNEPLTVQDPLGVTTTNTYDSNGNLLTSARPLTGTTPLQTAVVTRTYGDPSHPGDVTKTTDPRGKDTVYTYDTYGDLASVTDPTGRKTTYTYNLVGWRTSTVTPTGNATGGTPSQHTISYSNFTGFGQPKTVTDQLAHVTTYAYDADQNLTDVTDADSRHTVTTYDAENNPTLVTRPGSVTQGTSYDDNGNVATQTDGLSHTTTYAYDALDRVSSVTDPLSRVTSYTYDKDSNLATLVQPGTPSGSLTTTYNYDNANERTGISYSDGVTHSVTYTYDADGQRATMVDGTGTTTYAIDSLHRLTSLTNGHGRVVGYTYDLAGRATAIAYPSNGGMLTRGYDDAGRLTSTTDWLSTPTTNIFGYDDDGNWTATTYGNADTATRTFDRADELTALTYKKGATTLGTLTYTRSNAGLLSTTTPSAGAPGTTDSYTYNPRAQLTSANASGTTWAYDAADRITTMNGSTLAYDNADQLTSLTPATGPATSFTFDNRGNRTAATLSGAGSSTAYAYDQAGNMTSYTPAGGTASTYKYDGDGLRSSKTPAGVSQTWTAWDTVTAGVPLLLSDASTTFYVYGPDDVPIEQIKSGSVNTYLMGDQLGSTILLTGSAGTVSGTWAYDAYGNTTVHTGSGATPLLYNGQYLDTESGLYYLRARLFDPLIAQFTERDPIVFATHTPYGFAGADPLNNSDPSGLFCLGRLIGHWCPSTSSSSGPAEVRNPELEPIESIGRADIFVYEHINFSESQCFGICFGVGLQDGYASVSAGAVGFSTPGVNVDWASRTPDCQNEVSFQAGGGDVVGLNGSVGIRPDGSVDAGDYQEGVSIRPYGYWAGPVRTWSHKF